MATPKGTCSLTRNPDNLAWFNDFEKDLNSKGFRPEGHHSDEVLTRVEASPKGIQLEWSRWKEVTRDNRTICFNPAAPCPSFGPKTYQDSRLSGRVHRLLRNGTGRGHECQEIRPSPLTGSRDVEVNNQSLKRGEHTIALDCYIPEKPDGLFANFHKISGNRSYPINEDVNNLRSLENSIYEACMPTKESNPFQNLLRALVEIVALFK